MSRTIGVSLSVFLGIASSGMADASTFTVVPFEFDPDGTNLVRLTNTPTLSKYYIVASPDGSKVAFVEDDGGTRNENIYVVNTDGSNVMPSSEVRRRVSAVSSSVPRSIYSNNPRGRTWRARRR